jgi:hypothetical protein
MVIYLSRCEQKIDMIYSELSFPVYILLVSIDERTEKAAIHDQGLLQFHQALRAPSSSLGHTLRTEFCHHWSQ